MPPHRLNAIRFLLNGVVVWIVAALVRPSLASVFLLAAIIFTVFCRFLVSPLADFTENRER